MPLTQREAQRGHVLALLASGKVTTAQAAEALGITRRQVRRLGARLRAGGPTTLAHGNRGRRAGHAVPDNLRGHILTLARGKYAGFNDVHLTEEAHRGRGAPREPGHRAPGPAGGGPPLAAPPPLPAAPEPAPPAPAGRAPGPVRREPLCMV